MSWMSLYVILFLFIHGEITAGTPLSIPSHDTSLPEKGSCFSGKPVRSSDSLYLGNGDGQNILRLEFQISDLTSNLSSFDLRTYDSEGVIFYGDVGKGNWFVLGIREKKLEVQMSNNHGQMMLSKWGPDVSDGIWRKVTVDSSINTIEVRVDGEVVVQLTHHVNTQLSSPVHSTLAIILGDLPSGSNLQLFRPLQPTLDGCMRNWAWVKKHTQALDAALVEDENRRCFEKEEPGSFFPGHGYAIFKPAAFQSTDNETWGLSVKVSFRVIDHGGVLFSLYRAGNAKALTITLDWEKQVLLVTVFEKLAGSVTFPVNLCPGHWLSVDILIQSNQIVLKTAEGTSSWDIKPTDSKALEDEWFDPTTEISIGGFPEHSAKKEPSFYGCLKMSLQGKELDLDTAHYKHPHVRSHSCPVGL